MKSIRPVALLLAASSVIAQTPEWVFLDGPPHAMGVGVVRQSNGRHFVAGPGGSVFEVDGDRWLHRPTQGGPSARTLPSYCYDSSRDIVYFFGGKRDLNFYGDLWAWDGTKWTDVTPASGPAPRWGALMAYDIVRDRVVLYGGAQGSGFDDTWEFDGTNWHATTPSVTPGDRGTAMSYDLVRQQCVLVNHTGSSGSPGTTWTWNGSDWTLVDSNGPATGQGSAMAYDLARDVTVFAGGNPVSDQIWEWNGASWTQVGILGPAARSRPSMSYDPHLGGVRYFGGYTITQSYSGTVQGSNRTDAWLWDGTAMQSIHGDLRPPNRWSSTFVADPFRDTLLMYGGRLGLTNYGDTWTFDGDRWTLQTPSNSPGPRARATAVAEPNTGAVLLFGGSAPGATPDDLWRWDGSDWTEVVVTGTRPAARSAASMAADPSTGDVYLFGGSGGGYRNDLWKWDGTNWTQLATGGPPPREQAALTVDPVTGDLLMFGGRDGATLADQKSDLWRFSNGSWQLLTPPLPMIPLFYPHLYFDPGLGQIVLVGTNPGGGSEKFAFDGIGWTLLHASQDWQTGGQPAYRAADGNTYVYRGESLQVLTSAPAIAEDLGGKCGQNPPHVSLRTRPRVGSPEFGFEIQSAPGEFAFFCISEDTGALPLFNCTVLLAGSITPMFAITDASGRATQPIPLPNNMALRGQDFFVHGSAWDVNEPLSQLRLANAWRFLIGD